MQRRYRGQPADAIDEWVARLLDIYDRYKASGLADSQFDVALAAGGATHAQRLGEMLLFDRLDHAGFALDSKDAGPDFRVEADGAVGWLELVTPSTGDDSCIDVMDAAYDPLNPSADSTQKLRDLKLLRVTQALKAKADVLRGYRERGVIPKDGPCVIVVNDALLAANFAMIGVSHGADVGIGGASLIEHAALGTGPAHWELEGDSGAYVAVSSSRPHVQKTREVTVPVGSFGTETMRYVSAALQVTLREDYGFAATLREKPAAAPLLHRGTLLQNASATNGLPVSWKERLLSP